MKAIKYGPGSSFIAVRIFLCASMLLMAMGSMPSSARAAGIYTHSWFVEQAINKLRNYNNGLSGKPYKDLINILEAYPAIVNYGAAFPDVASKAFESWGEGVHDTDDMRWGIYINYVQYLKDKGVQDDLIAYKTFLEDPAYLHNNPRFRQALMDQLFGSFKNNPRSEYDKKMIAFLFGLIAHQEADTPWHYNNEGVVGFEPYLQSLENPPKPGFVYEGIFDTILFSFDLWQLPPKAHGIDFTFFTPNLKQVIRNASAATNYTPAPPIICYEMIPKVWTWCPVDMMDGGNDLVKTYFLAMVAIGQWTPQTQAQRDLIQNYAIGGINNGAELVAAAWAHTWDLYSAEIEPPVTQIVITPTSPTGSNGWYNTQPVTVAFTVSGDNGPFATYYTDESGVQQTYTGPITISAEGYHIYYYYSVNALGKAEAVHDQIIKIDLSAPTIEGAAATLPNANVWYKHPVTVHFTAEDLLSGIESLTPDVLVSTEGAGQAVIGTAVNGAGLASSVIVQPINIDLTAPTVTITLDQTSYLRTQPFVVHFSGSDALSGLASLAGRFNAQVVTDGQVIDLFWLPAGTHALTVRAEDLAGNITNQSKEITITTSLKGLQATLSRLCQEKAIKNSGLCMSLSAKLKTALAAQDRGSLTAAANMLHAFTNAVRALSGKGITAKAATLLIGDANQVINQLKTKGPKK